MTVLHTARRGQAIVEFALVAPVFVVFTFGVIQLALVFISFYSETTAARETARWLAVNANADDATVAAHVQSSLPPGLVGGAPGLVAAGGASTDTSYQVGDMQVTFTPCVPTGSPRVCSHPGRAPGGTLHVEMRYDVINLLFAPTLPLPRLLPAYRVYVMAE
jgi:Flp pilus assembly protein TadG